MPVEGLGGIEEEFGETAIAAAGLVAGVPRARVPAPKLSSEPLMQPPVPAPATLAVLLRAGFELHIFRLIRPLFITPFSVLPPSTEPLCRIVCLRKYLHP